MPEISGFFGMWNSSPVGNGQRGQSRARASNHFDEEQIAAHTPADMPRKPGGITPSVGRTGEVKK